MRALLERLEAGALSPELALMQALLATRDLSELERALAQLAQERAGCAGEALQRLLAEHRPGAARIVEMAREEQQVNTRSPDEQLAACRRFFDRLVAHSEEASVALYSLGSAEILARASEEIVAFLRRHGLLSQASRALDLGCGIGRLAQALAPHLAHVEGLDLSPEMVKAARRRCAGLDNVRISPCNGRDLDGVAARSQELVLAVDSMPYIVQAGGELLEVMFAELARVLACGGSLVVLNFSYRGDLARDGEDAARLGERHGLTLERAGERPFRLWDGAAFVWRLAA